MSDAPDAVYQLDASLGERLLLALLWRHAGGGSLVVWPSAPRLAELTGQTERSVRRQLARLVELGALTRLSSRPDSARRQGKAWALNPAPGVTLSGRSPCPVGHPVRSVTVPEVSALPCPTRPADPVRPDRPTLSDQSDGTTREPTREPSTTLAGGGSFDSGILFELDMVRRMVEGQTGKRIGAIGTTYLEGMGPAVAELGLDEVKAIVECYARATCAGQVPQQFWRRIFRGDGFNAAVELYDLHKAKLKAEAQAKATLEAEAAQAVELADNPVDLEALLAETTPNFLRRST